MAPRWHASAPDDDELFSTVAAAERTALAWERTGFSVAAVGALLFHAGEKAGSPLPLIAGVVTLLLALLLAGVLAPLRYRWVVRAIQRGDSPFVAAPMTGLVAVIAVICVVAVSSVLL